MDHSVELVMSDIFLFLDMGVGIACFGMLLRVSGRLVGLEARVVDVERRVNTLELKGAVSALGNR